MRRHGSSQAPAMRFDGNFIMHRKRWPLHSMIKVPRHLAPSGREKKLKRGKPIKDIKWDHIGKVELE